MSRFGVWLLKREGHWPHDEIERACWTKPEKKYYRTRVEPVLNQLRRKWQVADLFPPELGLDEWRASKCNAGAPFPPGKFLDIRVTHELKKKGFHGTSFTTRQYENLLLIQVDLNSPMKDLLEHTRQALRIGQNQYREVMKARGHKLPNSRRRFEDYDLHLKIWDLNKDGKRNAEIARLVFPNLAVQSALYKVRDHLKAANKLISGGYREIS